MTGYLVSGGLGALGDESAWEDAGAGLLLVTSLAARGSSAVDHWGCTVAVWGSGADWDRDDRCGAHNHNNRAAGSGSLIDACWVGSG